MKLPLVSGRQVLAALRRLGFVEIHRRGSHVKMEHPDGRRIVFPFKMKLIVTLLKVHCRTLTLI
jgi:predicted RNA binding protein YcfA (HicA-like mRNA interferase family)